MEDHDPESSRRAGPQFDVKYGSGSFFEGLGDNMIYDEFELTVILEI